MNRLVRRRGTIDLNPWNRPTFTNSDLGASSRRKGIDGVARKGLRVEQIMGKLREAEIAIGKGIMGATFTLVALSALA
jgi:hypothetical protein